MQRESLRDISSIKKEIDPKYLLLRLRPDSFSSSPVDGEHRSDGAFLGARHKFPEVLLQRLDRTLLFLGVGVDLQRDSPTETAQTLPENEKE